MQKYKLIKQDTFNNLIINAIYYIDETNFNGLYNNNKIFTGYRITEWQKKNMFEIIK